MEETAFFAMLSRMRYIDRWALMRNTLDENIAEHSLDVAVIAHGLAVIRNVYFKGNVDPYKVAIFGIYHDTSEIITGDMPTPIKYYSPEIKTAYKKVEKVANRQLLKELPKEMQKYYKDIFAESEDDAELWQLVKAADKISAYIKCLEELSMGNKDFSEAEKATRRAVLEMKLPEAEYFMNYCIPAYGRTLDDTVIKKEENSSK